MSIEQIVAAMPKVENLFVGELAERYEPPFDCFHDGTIAQCLHLAREGYRLVPSVVELAAYFEGVLVFPSIEDMWKLHRWLLERGDDE